MPPSAIVPAAGLDGALPDGELLVGDHQIGVDLHEGAQTGTLGTGAEGVIEGEHPRGELLDADAVIHTGVLLGEGDVLAADDIHHRNGRR